MVRPFSVPVASAPRLRARWPPQGPSPPGAAVRGSAAGCDARCGTAEEGALAAGSAPAHVPDRIRWAVEAVDPRPGERIRGDGGIGVVGRLPL
ncbi:hypothetical protein GCM10009605_21350 [Nocardiopsis composta]